MGTAEVSDPRFEKPTFDGFFSFFYKIKATEVS